MINCRHFWRNPISKMFMGEITRNRIFIKALTQGKKKTEKWLAVQCNILDPFVRNLWKQSYITTPVNESGLYSIHNIFPILGMIYYPDIFKSWSVFTRAAVRQWRWRRTAAYVTAAVKVIIGESSQGCRSRGGPGDRGPDFGRSFPVSQLRGQIMPTK